MEQSNNEGKLPKYIVYSLIIINIIIIGLCIYTYIDYNKKSTYYKFHKSFQTEVKDVFKVAQQEWMLHSMTSVDTKIYSRVDGVDCGQNFEYPLVDNLSYIIKINQKGYVTEYYITNLESDYSYKGEDLKVENINDINYFKENKTNPKVNLSCNNGIPYNNGIPITE